MKMRLAAVLVLLAGPAAAEQRLPDCSAEKTVRWVLKNRINDTYAADQWACRYLGVHVWNTKAKCY